MKRKLLFLTAAVISTASISAQGFEKSATMNSKKVVTCDMGFAYLVENTYAGDTVYIMLARDQEYPILKNYVKVDIGDRQTTIDFLNKMLYTFETMQKGDSFDPGLPSGNKVYYYSSMGMKGIGITGASGMWSRLSKAHINSMLKYFNKK